MEAKTTIQSEKNGDIPTPPIPIKKEKKKPVKKDVKSTKDALREKQVLKTIAKVKEEQAKRREEEERIRKAEEEETRRIEEENRIYQEKKRLEAERKERKKQKEKEKKQKLKEDGKLLTEKQKEDRRKVIELAQLRGINLEHGKTDIKKPNYSKLKKKTQIPTVSVVTTTPEISSVSEKQIDSDDDIMNDWQDLAEEIQQIDEISDEKIDYDHLIKENEFPEEIINEMNVIESSYNVSKSSENHISEQEKINLIQETKQRIETEYLKDSECLDSSKLRAGVICVLGHVDTGKTKILDKLRNTNVQNREAGGITQQIGATNVPTENIISSTVMCNYFKPSNLLLPGLLIIDTPGHESFSNMRIRGSSLCDFAILVVDLMHGLEEQTKESIRILRSRKTPFVVALNKIDRLYHWKSFPNLQVEDTISKQEEVTMNDFNTKLKKVIQDFAMVEINVDLFYNHPDSSDYVSMVPTSAHSGDGMGDLLAFICLEMQRTLKKRLTFSENLKASVMEVKETIGLGTSLDVIVVNGRLREGDTVVLAGQEGPIVTPIRSILIPAPMSELRVKGSYTHLKEVVGAQGVKIIGKDFEKALAGLPLYVARNFGEELYYSLEVSQGLKSALKAISVSSIGVYVVASTLGSLESLLVYLKSVNIPYSGISIGTVHKKDVMKSSIMIEKDLKWAVILAFDVKVDKDAQKFANEVGVRIFTSEIIYHLQAKMEEYVEELMKDNRRKHRDLAVFPVKLTIIPNMIFNKRAPIVMGVHVEAGLLREGTPICVSTKDNISLGRIFSIEYNHKTVQDARTGQDVCIRIDPVDGDAPKLFGRHFDETDILISKISRESIDIVKQFFRNDLNKEDWKLMVELKKLLSIM